MNPGIGLAVKTLDLKFCLLLRSQVQNLKCAILLSILLGLVHTEQLLWLQLSFPQVDGRIGLLELIEMRVNWFRQLSYEKKGRKNTNMKT